MSGQLLVELNDLRIAEKELSQLLVRLQADEQEARALYARLNDWKGQSADYTREQIEAFFAGLSSRIQSIEQQKQTLIQYIEIMIQTDQER
ncbi:hypothetical protein PAECIP112173_04038 [Paenibacillus sp. JJ-100]|uniref:hypothetical protein n=1 Tax=Paenibacillus sp. JJ-100 TaxID=2974896 RepID=UPI0022FF7F50|nr:hypothetical protein [Paenibacillus sp. JJ-100]CAI6083726.1 hypothetical protein PAECIP112173_04038 [Paenibacillus sp. JJ-100]